METLYLFVILSAWDNKLVERTEVFSKTSAECELHYVRYSELLEAEAKENSKFMWTITECRQVHSE